MKFLHLADLHLGKRLNDFDLLADQRHMLTQALKLAADEAVDAVLLAGDLYDKAIPSGGAVALLDWFLTSMAEAGLPVFAVSGNHDGADRLDYGQGPVCQVPGPHRRALFRHARAAAPAGRIRAGRVVAAALRQTGHRGAFLP